MNAETIITLIHNAPIAAVASAEIGLVTAAAVIVVRTASAYIHSQPKRWVRPVAANDWRDTVSPETHWEAVKSTILHNKVEAAKTRIVAARSNSLIDISGE